MNYYCYMCTQGWLIAHPEYALICGLQWMVVVKTILNLTFCFVSFFFLVVHTNCACLCYSISFQVTQGRLDRNWVPPAVKFVLISVSEVSIDIQHWQHNLPVKTYLNYEQHEQSVSCLQINLVNQLWNYLGIDYELRQTRSPRVEYHQVRRNAEAVGRYARKYLTDYQKPLSKSPTLCSRYLIGTQIILI